MSVLDWTGSPTFQVPTNHSKNGTSTRFFESPFCFVLQAKLNMWLSLLIAKKKFCIIYLYLSERCCFFYLHSHLMNLCIIFDVSFFTNKVICRYLICFVPSAVAPPRSAAFIGLFVWVWAPSPRCRSDTCPLCSPGPVLSRGSAQQCFPVCLSD